MLNLNPNQNWGLSEPELSLFIIIYVHQNKYCMDMKKMEDISRAKLHIKNTTTQMICLLKAVENSSGPTRPPVKELQFNG